MKRKRFTEAQIIGILKEAEAGAKTQDICRKHGIAEQTCYRWRSKYGEMQVSEAKKLKDLETENRKLNPSTLGEGPSKPPSDSSVQLPSFSGETSAPSRSGRVRHAGMGGVVQ